MIEKTIKGYRDFELNHYKDRYIKYYLNSPEKPKGLILYIAGFGDDTSIEYRKKLLQYFSENYNYASATVDYNAIYSRPNQGASVKIPNLVEIVIRSFFNDFSSPLFDLIQRFANMRTDKSQPLYVPAYILPKYNDYQNFGLLAAIDCIFVLKDIFDKYKNQIPKKIILIGSSYGGYIANLITKFIPNSISAVFDNSSWSNINMRYINGIEHGKEEFFILISRELSLRFSTTTPWQTAFENLPNYFDNNRKMIREFPEKHLKVMYENNADKITYRFIHSYKDNIAPTEEKIELVNKMKNLGFNVDIEIFEEKDIDGKFIKSMEHSMDISIREFFKYMYEKHKNEIKERDRLDFEFEHEIEYPCEDISYKIKFLENNIKMEINEI